MVTLTKTTWARVISSSAHCTLSQHNKQDGRRERKLAKAADQIVRLFDERRHNVVA